MLCEKGNVIFLGLRDGEYGVLTGWAGVVHANILVLDGAAVVGILAWEEKAVLASMTAAVHFRGDEAHAWRCCGC